MPGVGIPGAGRGRATVAALVVGWVLIAGGTAGGVVALGRDGGSHGSGDALGAGASGTASATPSATDGVSSSPSETPSPTPTTSSSSSSPTPTPTPTPSSTVTGKVVKGVHTGDVRFFLMTVPSDASVIGTPEGDTLTRDTVAGWYANSAHVRQELDGLHFQGGAIRAYQTGDAKYHVWVRLLHFATADGAKGWMAADQPKPAWKAFPFPGNPDLVAHDIPLNPTAGTAEMRAIGCRGDVYFEVYVVGKPPLDHAVLIDRARKQMARLDTGS